MTFAIQEIVESDVRRLAEIDEAAYTTDPMRQSLSTFATASPELQERHINWSAETLRQRLREDNTSVFLKVIEEDSGEIAGWVDWKKPGLAAPAEEEKPIPELSSEEARELSPCLNFSAVASFMGMYEAARRKYMNGRTDYWCLAKVVVDPKYQRRGIGNLLIRHMLPSIDASGLDVYLGTPPYSLRLCEQNDFRVLDKISCLDGSWHFTIMLREGKRV